MCNVDGDVVGRTHESIIQSHFGGGRNREFGGRSRYYRMFVARAGAQPSNPGVPLLFQGVLCI